jgi:hypothetical protein
VTSVQLLATANPLSSSLILFTMMLEAFFNWIRPMFAGEFEGFRDIPKQTAILELPEVRVPSTLNP